MKSGKRILVTVLDWGLGHAARCIPIIRILLQRNHEVLIASNGNALELLKIEFPGLHFFELPPYNPVYPTSGKNMVTKMAFQLPKFLGAVKKEHKHTEEIVKQHQIDFVISDNRYGCFSERIKSVLITHQVNIMMPETHKSIEKTVNTYNHGLIQKFSECWIPSPPNSLIPALIKNNGAFKARYVGYLSRFQRKNVPKKYDLLVLCTGPEPQRGIFEKLVAAQLENVPLNALIVKGVPGKNGQAIYGKGKIKYADMLPSEVINEIVESSGLVISRPGYSTIMDLIQLQAKGVFIPTPGQTEQEYIAGELTQKAIAFCQNQGEFDLENALHESKKYNGFAGIKGDDDLLKQAIDSIK